MSKYCMGACELKEPASKYNRRVQDAIDSLQHQPSYAIVDKGLNPDEHSCILVLDGKFYGMGYLPREVSITEPEDLKDYLTQYKENSIILNLIYGYAARFPEKKIEFHGMSMSEDVLVQSNQ